MQKSWVEQIKNVLKDATTVPQPGSTAVDMTTTDMPAVVRAHMGSIMQQCKAAEARSKDPMTIAHLQYVQGKLKKLLENKD
jgi:hypothetical protein